MLDRVRLPDQNSRARLIGLGGAKRRDIENVSGACLVIHETEIEISAPNEESICVAKKLILKCIQHGQAANKVVEGQRLVKNAVWNDLVMAAHYTFHS